MPSSMPHALSMDSFLDVPLSPRSIQEAAQREEEERARFASLGKSPNQRLANLHFIKQCCNETLVSRRPRSAQLQTELRVSTKMASPGGKGTFLSDPSSPPFSGGDPPSAAPLRLNGGAGGGNAKLDLHRPDPIKLEEPTPAPARSELNYGQVLLLGCTGRHLSLAEPIEIAKANWANDYGPIDPDLETIPYSRTYLYNLFKKRDPRFAQLCRSHNIHYAF